MLTGSITGDIKYQFQHGNMVIKLILVNVAVFVFFGLFNAISFLTQSYTAYNLVLTSVEVPASLTLLLHQPWSLLTYMFSHTGLLHVAFNMLWFYWFGEIFVLYLGDKKILPLYILGGLAGALFYILAFNLIPVFKPSVSVSLMLGASASILAIAAAAATINPEHEVSLLFFGAVKIKYIVLISLLLDAYNIPNGNAGGYIAHMGGALSGFLFIKSLRSGFDITAPFAGLFKRIGSVFKPKRKVKVSYRNTEPKPAPGVSRNSSEQDKVDEILDKIARSGYDSLSKEEKDFLFKYSNK